MNVYLNQGTGIMSFIVTMYFMHSNVFFKKFLLMSEQIIFAVYSYTM